MPSGSTLDSPGAVTTRSGCASTSAAELTLVEAPVTLKYRVPEVVGYLPAAVGWFWV